MSLFCDTSRTRTMPMKRSKQTQISEQTRTKRHQSPPVHGGAGSHGAEQYENWRSAGSYWTDQVGGGYPAMCKPPYMDVQTVKTNLTFDRAAMLEDQSHCLLLVEPVLLPHLGHTGVTRETLPGDRPLFYPNGHKKHGLGATVRSTLYQSTSAPTLSVGTQNSCNGRQQQPPSDWAGSSAYFSLSENSSTGRSEVSAAIPAGQGGMFPTDVWGPPPTGGGTRSRTAAEWSTGCSTNVGRRTGSRKAGTGEAKRAVSRSSTTSQQKGEEFQAQQQQHDFESSTSPNQAPSEPQTSTASRTALSGLRVTPDRTGPTGFDAAGRDSEWLVERRAADQEARELLCALKHNNTRLWYLVGGRV